MLDGGCLLLGSRGERVALHSQLPDRSRGLLGTPVKRPRHPPQVAGQPPRRPPEHPRQHTGEHRSGHHHLEYLPSCPLHDRILGHRHNEPPRRVDSAGRNRRGDVVDRGIEHLREAQPRCRVAPGTAPGLSQGGEETISFGQFGSDSGTIWVGDQHVTAREQDRVALVERMDFTYPIGQRLEIEVEAGDPRKPTVNENRAHQRGDQQLAAGDRIEIGLDPGVSTGSLGDEKIISGALSLVVDQWLEEQVTGTAIPVGNKPAAAVVPGRADKLGITTVERVGFPQRVDGEHLGFIGQCLPQHGIERNAIGHTPPPP